LHALHTTRLPMISYHDKTASYASNGDSMYQWEIWPLQAPLSWVQGHGQLSNLPLLEVVLEKCWNHACTSGTKT